jgi:prepilin-type N-terminal cleavage/methylation domain
MKITKGFTLIEILVALLAASIISIMSFEFLSNSVFLKERVDANIKRDSDHMNTINTIRLDLMQAVPFDMKDQNGRELEVSFIGNSLDRVMTFVSLSTSDHLQITSKLRRVIYLYEDNQLIRVTTLSNKEQVEISRKTLIKNVENLEIRFGEELDEAEIDWPNLKHNSNIKFPQVYF